MTIEEIKKALEQDKDLAKKVALLASESEQGKEILNNFAKTKVDEAVKEKTAEIYNSFDNDLFEVLGERKQHDQKTYDFVKKVGAELKELRGKADELNKDEKVKELKDKIKELENSGSHNSHWKQTHEETVAKFNKEKAALEEALRNKEKEFFEAQITAELTAGLSVLEFNKAIPQTAIDAVIEAEKKKIVQGAKIIDGKTVFHGEDGKPLLNKEYSPISSKELWEQRLEGLTAKDSGNADKGGGGANTTFSGNVKRTGEGDTAKISLQLDKSSFSTRREFMEVAIKTLREEGIDATSKDYQAAIDGAYKEYEVSKLKVQ